YGGETGQNIVFGQDVVALEPATFALAREVPNPVERPCCSSFPHPGDSAPVFDVIPYAEDGGLEFLPDLLVIADRIGCPAPFDPPVPCFEILVGAIGEGILIGKDMRPIWRNKRYRSTNVA